MYKKNHYLFLSVVMLALAIPITLFIARVEQKYTQEAASNPQTTVTIDTTQHIGMINQNYIGISTE